MPEVSEYVVNVKLAEILSKDLGIDTRAERITRARRPDINILVCVLRGNAWIIKSCFWVVLVTSLVRSAMRCIK